MRTTHWIACTLGLNWICCMGNTSEIPEDVRLKIDHLAQTKDQMGWGALYYDVAARVINEKHYKNVVEVGVALGGHAEHLLKHTQIENYYGVDPYRSYDPTDGFQIEIAAFSSLNVDKNFDFLCEWVRSLRLSEYLERCWLIREPSIEAAELFEEESFDCIFIDGDQRYAGVLADLQAWFPKLKTGHLMMGDDYWMEPVAAAVNDFFAAQGKEVFFLTSNAGYQIWAVYK